MSQFSSSDLKYVGEPSPHLLCPICLSPFLVPVTADACSHTYCRPCITEALSHTARCPVDRTPLNAAMLARANPIIQSLVNELLVECPYHEAGCPTSKIRRDALNSHLEDECMHTPTKCVIPGCEVTLPLVDMFEHQDIHKMQLQLEREPEQRPSSPPIPTPSQLQDAFYDLEDDGYVSDDAASPTTRPYSLRRLHRNWATLSRLSRPPSRLSSARETPPTNTRPLPPLPRGTPGQFPFLVRAISDYQAAEEGELSIQRGDLIRITGIRHDGWWEGHNIDSDGHTSGLLPRVFVEMFPPPDPARVEFADPDPHVPGEGGSFPLVTPVASGHDEFYERGPPQHGGHGDSAIGPAALSGEQDHTRRLSLALSTLSSMYTDSLSPPGRPEADSSFRLRSPDFPLTHLSPMRLRRESNPSELLQRSEDILYYVRASSMHRASRDDDFDFQEGDIMAVTDMAGGDMRGYLLDDHRRRDLEGRTRIPADKVVLFY